MGLTVKMERFCLKYHECGNASEAYRHAYNASKMVAQSVHSNAGNLLLNTEVARRIAELQAEDRKKSEITRERLLEELSCIIGSKITDYLTLTTAYVPAPGSEGDPDGDEIAVQKLVFKDFADLTDRQVRAIESVKEGKSGLELKLHGKSWSIERVCKMLGYDSPTVAEIKMSNELDRYDDEQLKAIADGGDL